MTVEQLIAVLKQHSPKMKVAVWDRKDEEAWELQADEIGPVRNVFGEIFLGFGSHS